MFCQYKNSLGKPFEGIHSSRIGPFAFVDTVATVIVAVLISWWFKTGFFKTFICIFILGIVLHWIFCVDTPVILFLKKIFS